MFAQAARRMGYEVAVWDPDAEAPAHRLASHSFSAPFSDLAAREQFSSTVHAVTFEWENVPAELCAWLERHHRVHPGSAVLRIIQDRLTQKQFLQSRGLPVPSFVPVQSADQLTAAVRALGLPAICKTATAGYDGKGQWVILRTSDLADVERAVLAGAQAGARWILESLVPFQRELSVLVVRGQAGECRTYPVVENQHERGILRLTLAPAAVNPAEARTAADLASQGVTALGGVGVFCVELFQLAGGELLVNEIAPRPHNSGHYTLDACSVSQFEQQVRVVCGLPLGETRLLSAAAMVNVIGEEVRHAASLPGYLHLLSIPGAILHLYGKRIVRAGRKMGHITFLDEHRDAAAKRAAQWIQHLS